MTATAKKGGETRKPTQAKAEVQLVEAMEEFRERERAKAAASTPERQLEADFRLGKARLKRDDAIRAALTAKLPRPRIIAITELSAQRIDQIRRGKRL